MTGRIAVFRGPAQPFEMVSAEVREPAAGEVLVRVECCTLCRSDLHTHAGRRSGPLPTVLGHEVVGRVAAVGPAVRPFADGAAVTVSDRVTWCITVGCGECYLCTAGVPQKCERLHKYGHERFSPENPWCGGLADYQLLVPGTTLCPVPSNVPEALAALAGCATATAVAVTRANNTNLAGKSVLILGAGVLGLSACAYAHRHGATVIVSDPQQPERARAFGAAHTISTDASELAAVIADVTWGRGADMAWELAGAASAVTTALDHVRIGGSVVLAGTVLPVAAVPLNPEQVVRRMLTIRGVHNYAPPDLAAALALLAETQSDYPWTTLIGPSFPLQEIDQAFSHAHAQPGVRVAVVPS